MLERLRLPVERAIRLVSHPPQFSAFDLRLVIRLMAILIAWEFLSVDFYALYRLIGGYEFHALEPQLLHRVSALWEPFVFGSPIRILILQMTTVALFLLAAVRVNRLLLTFAMIPALLFEWAAWKFRGDMFDADFPMAVLMIGLAWPGRWSWNSPGNKEVSLSATRFGIGVLLYLSLAYLMMGISKLEIPNWVATINLQNLYACLSSWHQVDLPPILDWSARSISNLFSAIPQLAILSAALTLVAELGWFTSLVSWRLRYVLPAVMFLGHIVIYLSSGLLFYSIALTAFSFVIPWRALSHGRPWVRYEGKPRYSFREVFADRRMTAFAAIAAIAVLVPRFTGKIYHPFNMFHFGWHYASCPAPTEVYRLGYWDANDTRWKIIPANYFGFLDFKGLLKQWGAATYAHATSESERELAKEQILQVIRAIRPHDSNRWALGPFALPNHLATYAEVRRRHDFQRIVLLKGIYHFEKHGKDVKWERVTDLELNLWEIQTQRLPSAAR